MARPLLFAAGLTVLLGLLAGAWVLAPRIQETLYVLEDLARGGAASRLKAERPQPAKRGIRFTIAGRERLGDLYTPGDAVRGGMVLVPGLTPRGRDDPLLQAFARTLARARFQVLVPALSGLRELRITPEDGRIIADATLHLKDRVQGRPVGLAAISFAAGPAVAALAGHGAAGTVDFAVLVGPYYDLEAALTFATTGHYRAAPGRPWRQRRANDYGKWAFVRSNLDGLESRQDRARLEAIARRKLDWPAAPVDDLAEGLGPEGRAVLALVTNRDPDRVPALIEALPEAITAPMRKLDPSRYDLGGSALHWVLIHGRNDPLLPETESLRFAAALPPERVDLYLVEGLDHVALDPEALPTAWKLFRATWQVLGFRGRPISPARSSGSAAPAR